MKNKIKNKLKLKLQIRFVLLSITSLLILQSLIVIISINRTLSHMNVKSDRLIKIIQTNPNSTQIQDLKYFSITHLKDQNNKKIILTDFSHAPFVNRQQALEYAKKINKTNSQKGYIDIYRYLVHKTKNSIKITFLARPGSIEAFRNNSITLIIISTSGILIMTFILILISGKVTSPLVKNHIKQKEFITSASHELKTPLTIINANVQLLESEIGKNEYISDIIKQTQRMTEMTHKLVYLSKLEEQTEQNIIKIDFSISDLAEDVAESYKTVANNCKKDFKTDFQKNLTYHGDEKAIRELMMILFDNALKYSTNKGNIESKLFLQNHSIKFVVENSINQTEQNQLENLTERFYRKDTSDKIKGFGIGLSIAKVVAEIHKGKLTIEVPEKNKIRISVVLK